MPKIHPYKLGGDTDYENAYERIAEKILTIWRTKTTVGDNDVDRLAIITAIQADLKTSHGGKNYSFDVIVDPVWKNNKKFVWIVIPAPEPNSSESIRDWVVRYYDSGTTTEQTQKKRELGAAVLFGCGR